MQPLFDFEAVAFPKLRLPAEILSPGHKKNGRLGETTVFSNVVIVERLAFARAAALGAAAARTAAVTTSCGAGICEKSSSCKGKNNESTLHSIICSIFLGINRAEISKSTSPSAIKLCP